MTAIGFFLYMTGRVIFELTDEESKTHLPFVVTGFCFIVVGITQFLWEKMP